MYFFHCLLSTFFLLTVGAQGSADAVIKISSLVEPWEKTTAEEHITKLKEKYGRLTDKELAATIKRAEQARHKQQSLLEASERERIVARKPKDIQVILDLCLARAQALEIRRDWATAENLHQEAIYALQLAQDPDDLSRALFFLAISAPSYHDARANAALAKLAAIMSLEAFREKFPLLKNLAPFTYKKEGQIPPPVQQTESMCLHFTQSIAEDIQVKDFITVFPVGDYAYSAKGNKLCVRGLNYGTTYKVTVKPGLQSQFGDILNKEVVIEQYLPDLESRIGFVSSRYILKRGEENLVPISTVNVQAFNLSVRSFSERNLINAAEHLKVLRGYPYHYGDYHKLGKTIYAGTYEVAAPQEENQYRNKTQVTNINLNKILKNAEPGLYLITANTDSGIGRNFAEAQQWLIVSDLGITTYKGTQDLQVDVRSLSTAEPLAGVELEVLAQNNEVLGKATTNHEGLATFPAALLQGEKVDVAEVLVAQQHGDLSFILLNEPAFDLTDRGVGGRASVGGPIEAYLYTDRGVYRGGETVHLNALVRNPQLKALPKLPLTLKLSRPDGGVLLQQTLVGTDQGHYSFDLALIKEARTGIWNISAYLDPKKSPIGQTTFQVEDFVPTRLLVQLQAPDQEWLPTQQLKLDVAARYLFGSAAPDLKSAGFLKLTKHPNPFAQFSGFSFGLVDEDFIENRTDLDQTTLNDQGKSELLVSLPETLKSTHPLQAQISVKVVGPGGKAQWGTLKRLVLLQPLVLGIRPTFMTEGLPPSAKEADFELISLDRRGIMQSEGDLEYELFVEDMHYNWFQPSGRYGPWEYRPVIQNRSLHKGTVHTSVDGPIRLTIPVSDWGSHRLVISNPRTKAATSIRFAKGYTTMPDRAVSPHRVAVVADKGKYKIGEVVSLHITAPFEGLARLVVANQDIIETQLLKLSRQGTDVAIKVTEAWGKGSYVIVNAFRPLNTPTTANELNLLPKRAIGVTWVGVDCSNHTLDIALHAPLEMRPKQKLTVPISVKGHSPKNMHLTLAAVDEGILQLTDFVSPSPLKYFLAKNQLGVEIRDLYGRIIDPQEGRKGILRVGGDIDALSRNLAALSKRSFKIVSLYSGLVALDAAGQGSVTLEIPEFDGQLRLMAVAFDDKHIGNAEARILVREPVVMEAALPRFLHEGDISEVPLILHNITGPVGEYQLTAEMVNTSGQQLHREDFNFTLRQNEQKILPFKFHAAQTGSLTLILVLKGPNGIAVEQTTEVSVQHKEQPEYHAHMVLLKPEESFKVIPGIFKGFHPETIRATLNLYANVPWDIERLLSNLQQYPYGCVEQLVSRGFAGVVNLLLAKKESVPQSRDNIKLLTHYLFEQQALDGSFSVWGNNSEKSGWLSIYAMHFLSRFWSEKWFPRLPYTQGISSICRSISYLETDPIPEKLFTVAYGMYVLVSSPPLAGSNTIQPGEVRYFFDRFYSSLPNKMAEGLMIATLAKIGDEERLAKALEQLVIAPKDPNLFFGSPLRDDAAFLAFILEASKLYPQTKLLSAIAAAATEGLSSRMQNATTPLSTNEMAWLLLATEQLLDNSSPKRLIKALWQGKALNQTHRLELSLDDVNRASELKNISPNSFWLTLGYNAVPIAPLAKDFKGINLTQSFYSLKGEAVSLDSLKSGENYVVVLEGTIIQPVPGASFLVVSRLAGGIEIENPNLNSSDLSAGDAFKWLENLSPINHREIRDDRFVAAFTLKDAQTTFKIAYVVRATVPGSYFWPALFVEDMYAPSYHGRTATDQIIIT